MKARSSRKGSTAEVVESSTHEREREPSFFSLKSSFYKLAFTALVLSCLSVAVLSYDVTGSQTSSSERKTGSDDGDVADKNTNDGSLVKSTERGGAISIAFIGNSILQVNNCPRMVQHMLQQRFNTVVQDSCLQGGATLPSLLKTGNGRTTVSNLLSKKWDFVVLQDQTQAPARPDMNFAALESMRHTYSKLLQETGATPVFLQTYAFRYPDLMGSGVLGSFIEFTDRLVAGYALYAATLSKLLPETPSRIARAGQAFRWLYENNHNLWEKLYGPDHVHPSPYGTFLEACCIYCAVVNEAPPYLDPQWWGDGLRMQPMVLPTAEEANELRRVACFVSGINDETCSVSQSEKTI
jgi:hypothetical protein